MENFINETINTKQLPRFEEVVYTSMHKNYWKVTLLNSAILFVILGIALVFGLVFRAEMKPNRLLFVVLYFVILATTVFFLRLGFLKKGYAFRNHDVLYKSGVVALKSMVIPYNRVQHVALHEGFISRIFGLATVEIFTAGGSSSDLEIPGIPKEEAENIKQLLTGKIQKQL
jgi:membrane protein YdbS with pleckstrin-like domain